MTTEDSIHDPAVDALLVKYLLGECSAEERASAARWIAASEDHRRYYQDFARLLQSARREMGEGPDPGEAWERFVSRLPQQDGRRRTPRSLFSRPRFWAAAAAAGLIMAGGWWALRRPSVPSGLIVLSSREEPRQDTLPDGTVVYLNKYSDLRFDADGKGHRKAVLQGEAFFQVAEHRDRPFEVHAGDITVTVLGTAFNVSERKTSTEVIVESGRVRVSAGQQSLQVEAHEKAVLNAAQGTLKKAAVDNVLYSYYRTHAFVCDRTPLKEVVAALSEGYQVEMVIANPALEDLPLTTTFHQDQPLDTVLAILAQTFPQLHYQREEGRVILK